MHSQLKSQILRMYAETWLLLYSKYCFLNGF